MILASGLTPVWQLTYQLDRFGTGEVNRAIRLRRCASGKVLNVGLVVHRAGVPVTILSIAGGATGELLKRDLRATNVRCRWIPVESETRICTTVLVTGENRTMTELVENGGPISESESEAYATAFPEEATRAKVVVLSGSPPQGLKPSFYRRLVETAVRSGNHGRGAAIVCDFRGPCLIESLGARPTIIKPNREELMETVAALGYAEPSDLSVATGVLREYGARWIVVTDGAKPTYVVDPDGRGIWLPTPEPIQVVNPLGCGDALAAGIAIGLERNWCVTDAVRFGQMAAVRNLEQSTPGRPDSARLTEDLKRFSDRKMENRDRD
ncbi:MAG: PfkB family carbohydrate kinase [Planctomycetia bacterium]|nr:PfkB family carbohydrate kinase [Planctomycetia bacterium]